MYLVFHTMLPRFILKIFVEVKDFRIGYSTSARYGIGLRPGGKIGGAPQRSSVSPRNSGRQSGQEAIFRDCPQVLGLW